MKLTYTRRHILQNSLKVLCGTGLSLLAMGFTQNRCQTVAGVTRTNGDPTYTTMLPIVLNQQIPITGVSYSPYRDGQSPDTGPYPTLDEIRQDIGILSTTLLCPYHSQGAINEVRTYGSDHNFEKIPELILEQGSSVKVNAGCWLGSNLDVNETLLAALITEANQNVNVVRVTVGNETQQFGTITEQRLIEYMQRVKSQVPQRVRVTTGDTWYRWLVQPNLAAAADFIQAHIFPYWEPTAVPISGALDFVKEKYQLLVDTYPGKEVVIGETGWSSAGETRGGAVPSLQNHNRYLTEFVAWAQEARISYYLFEAFDESWKTKNEGEVGGHWGIYYSNRTRKSTCQPL
ncbi:MAG: glycoside hydrolase family 17 protein [Anaerolineae bacterium]